jgi:hypothetical protein
MNIDRIHQPMDREQKGLAELVCLYSKLDKHPVLASAVKNLSANELVSTFYLMSQEGFPLGFALAYHELVTATRLPLRSSDQDGVANAPTTCESLCNRPPQKRFHFNGVEWGITDNWVDNR